MQARSQSLSRYSPSVYPGKITLFRGRELDPEFIKAQNALDHRTVDYLDTANGWSGLSSEPVEVYEVPGHHYTIVLEPHVGDLARQLRVCIGRALETISGSA